MFPEYKGKIMTVTGLIDAETVGIMFPHEHLYIMHQGPDIDLVDVDLVIEEVKQFKEMGGNAIVEQTNNRIGRNPEVLLRIAKETGLNILMGCGYYKDEWIPESFCSLTVDDIAEEIYNDIVKGIDVNGFSVHAGHIGEIGVSRCITEREERSLRGSARAQKVTGAAMTVHFDLDAQEEEHNYVIKILNDEGIDLRRVVFCHMIPKLENIDRIIRLAKQGLNISFETFSLDVDKRMQELIDTTMEEQIVSIKEMLRLGLIDHMVISQDVGFKAMLTANGGNGYAYIFKKLIPWFKRLKVNTYDIERLIWHNPRKIFTLFGRFPSY
jgi:phosphotriesterase-related protein